MKRFLLGLLALVVLYFAGRALVFALASDETRIRWRLEAMEEGYNEAQAGRTVGPLHRDWTHEGFPYDKEAIRGGIFKMYMDERDPETKELSTRVTVDWDSLVLDVRSEAATFEVPVTFARRENGAWNDSWKLRIQGELVQGPDGWQIVKSRHQDLQGTSLSR